MNRRQKLLEGLDLKNAIGIEIGPLDKPLLTREEGQVIYVDHADTNSLKAKYQNDPNVNTQNIVEVDAVWGQQTLQQAIGLDRKVDYIVASHVIEHVPDMIGWLDELRAVLKAGGEVRLAIPDRRFTFDYLRRETSLADVVNANIAHARAPLPIAILDFVLNVSLVDNVKAWTGELRPGNLAPMHPPSTAFQLAKEVSETGAYHDVHCWVFTPKSFVDLFASAAEAGLIDFECSRFYDTVPYEIEFLVTLKSSAYKAKSSAYKANVVKTWRDMATIVVERPKMEKPDNAGILEDIRDKLIGLQEQYTNLEANYRAEKISLLADLAQSRAEVEAVRSSTSWQLTAPLRAAVTLGSKLMTIRRDAAR